MLKNLSANTPRSASGRVDVHESDTSDVVDNAKDGMIIDNKLLNKLIEHVDQINRAQALEYVSATGRDHKTLQTVSQKTPLVGIQVPLAGEADQFVRF